MTIKEKQKIEELNNQIIILKQSKKDFNTFLKVALHKLVGKLQ